MTTPLQAVLISVSGPDRPGITATLSRIIASADLSILDMEQVVVQGLLSLSIVLEYHEDEQAGKPVLKDLLFAAKELGLEMNFRVLPAEAPDQIKTRYKYVLTLIGHQTIPADAITRIAEETATCGFNIETISQMKIEQVRCMEMTISCSEPEGATHLKNSLLPVGREYGVDIALQPDTIFRRIKRLVVFDLDSTLIQTEVIDELAERAGTGEAVKKITEQAMNGELDFAESLRLRVATLKGMEEKTLAEVYDKLPLTPGARNLIDTLKRLGYRTAVISGGFTYFTERIGKRLGLDYAFANTLEIKDGKLTGMVLEPVIDGEKKADLMGEIAEKEGIQMDQVIAIGDGANDLPMLHKAGLGIAFNAKPSVREAASHALNQNRLDTILFLLGVTGHDLLELKKSP